MVLNIAKLALVTGFAVMASAKGGKGKGKGGKYAYRKDSSESEEITNIDDDFVADTFGSQEDSQNPAIDMLPERLQKKEKKGKKDKQDKQDKPEKPEKKGKGKKGCNEPDFAKGVLASIADAIAQGEDDGHQLTMDDVKDMFMVILGDDFDPADSMGPGFERGFDFGGEKLAEGAMSGCRPECEDNPAAEGCQSCCRTFNHRVDWNCDSTDPLVPAAKCCTEWSEECFTTDSAENNNHACKDCYGYGRGGGYGYGRGGYYGRRRDGGGRGYGRGRRRRGSGYGRGRRRRGSGYGRGRL